LTTSYKSRGRVRSRERAPFSAKGFFIGIAVDPNPVLRAVRIRVENLPLDVGQDQLLIGRKIEFDLRPTTAEWRDGAQVTDLALTRDATPEVLENVPPDLIRRYR
jgi:hypothetical protein